MGDEAARGKQLRTIPAGDTLDQISMNPESFDELVTGRSVSFIHYRALPSPINKNDLGELRRAEGVDGTSSNGFLFKKAGCFSGAILGNSKKNEKEKGGFIDFSVARLVVPRFYDTDNGLATGERIYLQPGDRLFLKDIIVEVARSQLMQYRKDKFDQGIFPMLCVEHLVDHNNKEYTPGFHFDIKADGNIYWIAGRDNPGVNPDTGEGNVYTVRYRYNAHWYVGQLINEVRVISVTSEDNSTRTPVRMAYQAQIQREYVYHNIARDGTPNQSGDDPNLPNRVDRDPDPKEKEFEIQVEKSKFSFGE